MKFIVIAIWTGLVLGGMVSQVYALSEAEITFYLKEFFQAEEDKDILRIEKITGVPKELVQDGLKAEVQYLKNYARNFGFKYLSHRWADSKIIFIRPISNIAFVSQVLIIKILDGTDMLKKQEFFTIFEVHFDDRGTLNWRPVGQSRGDFEDIGRGS